jgi:LDH2 family malate/lactate/ureidoglycolate dehydrogenase
MAVVDGLVSMHFANVISRPVVAHNEGRQVPEGYLINEQGLPTTDPGVVVPPAGGLFGVSH